MHVLGPSPGERPDPREVLSDDEIAEDHAHGAAWTARERRQRVLLSAYDPIYTRDPDCGHHDLRGECRACRKDTT